MEIIKYGTKINQGILGIKGNHLRQFEISAVFVWKFVKLIIKIEIKIIKRTTFALNFPARHNNI